MKGFADIVGQPVTWWVCECRWGEVKAEGCCRQGSHCGDFCITSQSRKPFPLLLQLSWPLQGRRRQRCLLPLCGGCRLGGRLPLPLAWQQPAKETYKNKFRSVTSRRRATAWQVWIASLQYLLEDEITTGCRTRGQLRLSIAIADVQRLDRDDADFSVSDRVGRQLRTQVSRWSICLHQQ